MAAALSQDADAPPDARILGLTVMHRSSWAYLMGKYEAHAEAPRAEALDRVEARMREACRILSAPGPRGGDPESTRLSMQAYDVLNLSRSSWKHADGVEHLPPLARALSHTEGSYDRTFREWFTDDSGFVGSDLSDRFPEGDVPWLREMLEAVWDTHAFQEAMGWHNRVLAPSPSSGQEPLALMQLELAAVTARQAAGQALKAMEEMDPEECEDFAGMRRVLDRLGRLHRRSSDELTALTERNVTPAEEDEEPGPGPRI